MIEDKDGTLLSICKNVQLHKEQAEKFRLQMEQATDEATRQHYEQEMHKMLEMDKKYPEYGYASHKGYPTKAHREVCRKIGPSPIQRLTFKY